MPPVGFEPTISAGERPQTYALDSMATICHTKPYFLLLSFNQVPRWIRTGLTGEVRLYYDDVMTRIEMKVMGSIVALSAGKTVVMTLRGAEWGATMGGYSNILS